MGGGEQQNNSTQTATESEMSKRTEVRAELERLAQVNGGLLLAHKVVEAATDELSPLHTLFQWNDVKAGHSFRLQQAERLIRTVKIEYQSSDPTEHRIRVVRYAPNPLTDRGYGETEVMLRTTTRQPFLLQEWERCLGNVNRFAGLLRAAGHGELATEIQTAMQAARWQLEDHAEAPAMAGS